VTEPVPCPNCQALLRLPVGATTVRCPGCKAVLEIDPGDVPAEPAPAPAKPVPLPFGRRAKATPIPPPVAPPKPARGKVVKARVIADDPYSGAPETAQVLDDEAREREIRRQLDELEAVESVTREKFEELDQQCGNAQFGVKLLSFACFAGMISTLAPVLFIVGALASVLLVPILGLVLLALVVHWGMILVGFGYCLAGPKDMRGTAGVGLFFSLGHIFFNALSVVAFVAPMIAMDSLGERERTDVFLFSNLILTNSMCNMTVIADLPYYILYAGQMQWIATIMLMIAAGFEFAKISCLGLLTNQYSSACKDSDIAHQGMRFVYRVFAIVVLAPVAKALVALFVVSNIAWIPLLLISVGFYLWIAFAWYMQYVTFTDLIEILTAGRMNDRRRRIDYI
jgi:LSD1 subclass zinc finger protein